MERLTHEVDMGLEDWNQILYRRADDPEGTYDILDVAQMYACCDEAECERILQEISKKLRDYEDTGLMPEEIMELKCKQIAERPMDKPLAEARCYLDMPCRFQTPI